MIGFYESIPEVIEFLDDGGSIKFMRRSGRLVVEVGKGKWRNLKPYITKEHQLGHDVFCLSLLMQISEIELVSKATQ